MTFEAPRASEHTRVPHVPVNTRGSARSGFPQHERPPRPGGGVKSGRPQRQIWSWLRPELCVPMPTPPLRPVPTLVLTFLWPSRSGAQRPRGPFRSESHAPRQAASVGRVPPRCAVREGGHGPALGTPRRERAGRPPGSLDSL